MTITLQDIIGNLGSLTAAVGALGTAASALVDATKAFGGGVSNVGFGFIRKAAAPFESALNAANPAKGVETLRANWLSGMSVADQTAAAKSLIRLGLTTATAPHVATAVKNVDPRAFEQAIDKQTKGQALSDADKAVVATFDDTVEIRLAAAIQRADQQYKNAAKVLASAFAILLALAGVAIAQRGQAEPLDFLIALLIGVIATPLAPVAKDVTSALATFVAALKGGGAATKG